MIPLAFDSFGARSMATYIETAEVNILIDPAVALSPKRYGLPPHEKEIERKERLWKEIKQYATTADILVITHYHYDHHNPSAPEIYKDKIVYIKDPKNNINYSQKNRAKHFLNAINNRAAEITVTDGAQFSHGPVEIAFSEAVCHGVSSKLGYVVETFIDDGGERFIHTSDVEGPALDDQTTFIREHAPQTLILDGPMTYLLGYAYPSKYLRKSVENLIEIIQKTNIETIIPDHHLARDLEYKSQIHEVYEKAEDADVDILTAAEYTGKEADLLEAQRKELHATSS